MRIIKKADLKWMKEYTCKHCTSVLEVELSDVSTHPADQDGPRYSPEQKYFTCPVCNRVVYISSLDIPSVAI